MIALCLGGALSVWDDLRAARAMIGDAPHIIVACNFAGIAFEGRLDGWVTLHPEMFDDWRRERAGLGRNTDYQAFTFKPWPDFAGQVRAYHWYGSSGLYMAQIALEEMGASGAILCGVPMQNEASHIHWGQWKDAHLYRAAFQRAKASGSNIKSMSGWTAETLGCPDEEWVRSCVSKC